MTPVFIGQHELNLLLFHMEATEKIPGILLLLTEKFKPFFSFPLRLDISKKLSQCLLGKVIENFLITRHFRENT